MTSEGVENIIFSSSATVYGLAKEMPVTEETSVQTAMSPYGNTKQIGEENITVQIDYFVKKSVDEGIHLIFHNHKICFIHFANLVQLKVATKPVY
jgi:GDP-D-mannose dehydratase